MNAGMMNPAVQLLLPLCQGIIADMLQKPKLSEGVKTLSIQLDEQFAAMAERYFDNLCDGRVEVPHQFDELVRRICCKATIKHEDAENQQYVRKEKLPHRVFLAAIDNISARPALADEVVDTYFVGLTPDERKVVKQYAKGRPTVRMQAAAVNMTEEQYMGALETAMNKTSNNKHE